MHKFIALYAGDRAYRKVRFLAMYCAIGLSASFVQEAQAQPATNEQLYKQLQGAIYTLVSGRAPDAPPNSSDPVIQIVAAPTSADWADARHGAYGAASIADRVPSEGELYNPRSDSFYELYYKFLRSIKLPPGPTDAQIAHIEQLRVKSDVALQAWQKERSSAKERYQKEEVDAKKNSAEPPIKFYVWLSQELETQKLSSLRTALNLQDAQYFAALQDAYHGNDLVINDISLARATPQPMLDELDNSFEMAPASISPSLTKFLAAAASADTANPDHPKTRWEITKSTKTRDFSTHSSSGSGGANFGLFKVGGEGGSNSQSLNTSSDVFKLTIEFSAWQQFYVTRPWFKPSYFRNYVNDSQFDFGDQKLFFVNPHNALFNDHGELHYTVKSFIVVYKPTITVTLDHGDYVQFKNSWHASGSGGFGPFSVGASGSGSSEHEKWNDSGNTVSLSSATEMPQIIAVTLEPLP